MRSFSEVVVLIGSLLLWMAAVGSACCAIAYVAVMEVYGSVAPDNLALRLQIAFAAGAGIAMLMSVDSRAGKRYMRFVSQFGASRDDEPDALPSVLTTTG